MDSLHIPSHTSLYASHYGSKVMFYNSVREQTYDSQQPWSISPRQE